MLNAALHVLQMAFAMGWEILWPLILGFALSAVVQAVVSHKQMSRLLPDDSAKSLASTPATDSENATAKSTLEAFVGDADARTMLETVGAVLSIV